MKNYEGLLHFGLIEKKKKSRKKVLIIIINNEIK